MQVYITKSNANRILRQIDYDKLPDNPKIVIYKKPIFFLADWEIKKLRITKMLFENFETFVTEYYKPLDNSDTFSYVFEGGQAAYHSSNTCERLNATYINFKVPQNIKGNKDEVMRFRNWFKENQHLLETQKEIFDVRLAANFGAEAVEKVSGNNSGYSQKENYDLKELEQLIDDYIKREYTYLQNAEATEREVLKSFRKLTYLAYNNKPIKNKNNIDISDEKVKALLLSYDINYKQPVKDLLIEYYRVKNNPNLGFEGYLLERLGFKPCRYCFPDVIV